MIRSQYDSREGLQSSLESLGALHDVVNARQQVGYTGSELRPWTVLGRYSLGRNGYAGPYVGDAPRAFVPIEVAPFLRDVVPTEEVYRTVASATLTRESQVNLQVSGGGFAVPTEHVRCEECGDGWTVRTAHQSVLSKSTEELPLGDYVGQRPWAVHEALTARRDTDVARTVNPARMMVFSLYGHNRIDGRWRHVDGTYHIAHGDVADVTVQRFMHPPCHAAVEERASNADLRSVLDEAGLGGYEIERITIDEGNKGAAFLGTWYRVSEAGVPFLMQRASDGRYSIRWSIEDFNGGILDAVSSMPGHVSCGNRQEAVQSVQKLGGHLGFSVRPS